MRFKVLSEEIKKIVKLLDKMTDEVLFDISDGMMKLRLVNIERTAFAELGITVEMKEEGKFGLRVKDLKKINKMFKKDELEFYIEEEGFVTVKGEKKKIKFPLIEVEEFDQTLPEFDYTLTFKLDKAEYKQLVKDIKELGDAVKIDGDRLIVVDSQYEYEYKLEDVNGTGSITVGANLFELPLNLDMDIYEFKFGEGTPLVVQVDDDTVKGRFVIAPRYEDTE